MFSIDVLAVGVMCNVLDLVVEGGDETAGGELALLLLLLLTSCCRAARRAWLLALICSSVLVCFDTGPGRLCPPATPPT